MRAPVLLGEVRGVPARLDGPEGAATLQARSTFTFPSVQALSHEMLTSSVTEEEPCVTKKCDEKTYGVLCDVNVPNAVCLTVFQSKAC